MAHPKPDPEIYLTTVARLGVPPSHCIVFEDSAVGIRATLGAEFLRRDFPLEAVIRDYTEVKAGDLIESL